MQKKTIIALMTAIFLLCFALRIIHSLNLPLWTDEGWTTYFVEDQNIVETLNRIANDRHPPLYFLILTVWENFAGNTHLALRLLTIFTGLLTVAFMYRLAADWFDEKTALFASLLLSVLSISVYFSQEVRHYSWLTMFALISSVLFLRYIHRPRRSIGLLYLLSVTAIMLTHYFGLFIVLMQAVFAIFFWRTDLKQKRNITLIWIGAFILFLPWMIVVISTLSMITSGAGSLPGSFKSTYDDLIKILNLFFDGQIALLGGLFIVALLNIRKFNLYRFFILASGAGLFLIMWLLNYRIGVLSPRMIYFLTPCLIIICAYGLTQMNLRISYSLTAAFVFAALISSPIIQPHLNFNKMTQQIKAEYVPGDLIVMETGWTDFATEYEIKQAIPQSIPTLFATVRIWNPDLILEQADEMLPNYDTVWVVQWLQAAVILPRLLDGWHGFQLVDSYEIVNHDPLEVPDPIRIYRFQRPQLDKEPLIFGGKIELRDAIFPHSLSLNDDNLRVDLWWQTNEILLDRDYSSGIFLMDNNGKIVAQLDTGLAETPSSQWAPEELIHVTHLLPIPETLGAGNYTLNIVVYYFEEPDKPLTVESQSFLSLGSVSIQN